MNDKARKTNTLGYHRAMSVALLGADSKAVAWLDKKIAESPNGEDEEVVAAESQVVYLLMQIHNGITDGEGIE